MDDPTDGTSRWSHTFSSNHSSDETLKSVHDADLPRNPSRCAGLDLLKCSRTLWLKLSSSQTTKLNITSNHMSGLSLRSSRMTRLTLNLAVPYRDTISTANVTELPSYPKRLSPDDHKWSSANNRKWLSPNNRKRLSPKHRQRLSSERRQHRVRRGSHLLGIMLMKSEKQTKTNDGECVANQCRNGGICIVDLSAPAGFRCVCKPFYFGSLCDSSK